MNSMFSQNLNSSVSQCVYSSGKCCAGSTGEYFLFQLYNSFPWIVQNTIFKNISLVHEHLNIEHVRDDTFVFISGQNGFSLIKYERLDGVANLWQTFSSLHTVVLNYTMFLTTPSYITRFNFTQRPSEHILLPVITMLPLRGSPS